MYLTLFHVVSYVLLKKFLGAVGEDDSVLNA